MGSKFEKFDYFVVKNQRKFQKALLVQMIKSNESIENVLALFISGKKIKNDEKKVSSLPIESPPIKQGKSTSTT